MVIVEEEENQPVSINSMGGERQVYIDGDTWIRHIFHVNSASFASVGLRKVFCANPGPNCPTSLGALVSAPATSWNRFCRAADLLYSASESSYSSGSIPSVRSNGISSSWTLSQIRCPCEIAKRLLHWAEVSEGDSSPAESSWTSPNSPSLIKFPISHEEPIAMCSYNHLHSSSYETGQNLCNLCLDGRMEVRFRFFDDEQIARRNGAAQEQRTPVRVRTPWKKRVKRMFSFDSLGRYCANSGYPPAEGRVDLISPASASLSMASAASLAIPCGHVPPRRG